MMSSKVIKNKKTQKPRVRWRLLVRALFGSGSNAVSRYGGGAGWPGLVIDAGGNVCDDGLRRAMGARLRGEYYNAFMHVALSLFLILHVVNVTLHCRFEAPPPASFPRKTAVTVSCANIGGWHLRPGAGRA